MDPKSSRLGRSYWSAILLRGGDEDEDDVDVKTKANDEGKGKKQPLLAAPFRMNDLVKEEALIVDQPITTTDDDESSEEELDEGDDVLGDLRGDSPSGRSGTSRGSARNSMEDKMFGLGMRLDSRGVCAQPALPRAALTHCEKLVVPPYWRLPTHTLGSHTRPGSVVYTSSLSPLPGMPASSYSAYHE